MCKPEPRWKGPKVSVEERLENLYRSDEKLWQKVRKQRSGREARDARRKRLEDNVSRRCSERYWQSSGGVMGVSR